MEHPMRRRPLVAATIISAIGFAVGIGYRFFIDNAGERELANYLRSGLHGVGIALAGWAVQNTVGPNARSSLGAALRRLPLLVELVVRSLGIDARYRHRRCRPAVRIVRRAVWAAMV